MAKKSIKLEIGTVFQKTENGTYYFRYQVNERRKQVSLKTKNRAEAIKEAEAMIPVIKAPSLEVIAAHVSHAKSLSSKQSRLELKSVWDIDLITRIVSDQKLEDLEHVSSSIE